MKFDYEFYWSELSWKIYDVATILFDDTKNDIRSLPKTVRLQLLTTLSVVWSTAFSFLVFETYYSITYGWGGLVIGHIMVIIGAYYTFYSFKNAKEERRNTQYKNINTYDECYDFLRKKDGNKQ